MLEVQLHELVDEVSLHLVSRRVDVPVWPSVPNGGS